jgi:hypothetical protein
MRDDSGSENDTRRDDTRGDNARGDRTLRGNDDVARGENEVDAWGEDVGSLFEDTWRTAASPWDGAV